MTENGNRPPLGDDDQDENRRNFLTRSSVLVAVLAAAGIGKSSDAFALTDEEKHKLGAAVKQVIDNVVNKRARLDEAIKATSVNFPPEVEETLKKLTAADWETIGRINSRLAPLEKVLADGNNNGYAGM